MILVGDIITMDPARPRVAALGIDDGRICASGDPDDVRACLPPGTREVRARGTVVPGFTDSHFYLQRAALKVVDLFPDGDPDPARFARAMAATALDPDWNATAPPAVSDRLSGLRRVQPLLHALGITGVADPWATREAVRVYQEARRAGDLSMRVTMMPYFEGLRDHLVTVDEVMAALGGLGVGTGFGDDVLRFGAVKVYVDGEGKRMQALREDPWPATGDRGVQAIEGDELERLARFCAANGWALGVHAIGGAAMRVAIEAFERVDELLPLRHRRFRLIHAYLEVAAEVRAAAARMGVAVSSQPAIQWQNGAWLRETLGESAGESNPLRDWVDAGVRVALGSDGPYFPFDPLRLLWFTRTRAVRDHDDTLGPRQRLTAEESLRAMTADAAWAAFADDRGVLAPGRLADWAELTVDPLTCTDDALRKAGVVRTVSGGRIVFSAP